MKRLVNLTAMSPYKSYRALDSMPANQRLTLVREPDNPHDPNAIMVFLQVGYVSRDHAAQVSPYLDAKHEDVILGKLVHLHVNYGEIEIDDPIAINAENANKPAPDISFYTPSSAEYPNLTNAAGDLLQACLNFVRKVDRGEARSTHNYAEMLKAIELAKGYS
jgi:hypothetical protein